MPQAKILIVEDEKDVLELIRYNLDRAGYETDTALTGRQALDKAIDFGPDLVLLDLMLPEIDGLEVCDNLKSNAETADIPVIMLTAKSTEQDILTGFAMDAADYITKPFSPRDLLARIRNCPASKSRRRRIELFDDISSSIRLLLKLLPSREAMTRQNDGIKITHLCVLGVKTRFLGVLMTPK